MAAVEMDMIYPSILKQSTLHLQFPQQWLKSLTHPSELALVLGFEVGLGDAVTLSTENRIEAIDALDSLCNITAAEIVFMNLAEQERAV